MKNILKGKYVQPSYYVRLLGRWHQFSQGNKSVKECIVKFGEFIISYSAFITESEAQIHSKFKAA